MIVFIFTHVDLSISMCHLLEHLATPSTSMYHLIAHLATSSIRIFYLPAYLFELLSFVRLAFVGLHHFGTVSTHSAPLKCLQDRPKTQIGLVHPIKVGISIPFHQKLTVYSPITGFPSRSHVQYLFHLILSLFKIAPNCLLVAELCQNPSDVLHSS